MSNSRQRNVLFISYDGLVDPLGLSQVVYCIIELAKRIPARIIVLSYDKQEAMSDILKVKQIEEKLKDVGIEWLSLRYHKTPQFFSTLYDIIIGWIVGCRIIKKYNIAIVHCRSYVPALMGLFFKKLFKIKFIFDMRGFWADERIEGGIWSDSYLYKLTKYFEKKFILSADTIIALTENAKHEILSFDYFKKYLEICIIPTLVDTQLFRFNENKEIADDIDRICSNKFVFVYLGSLGTWYDVDAIYDFFIRAKALIDNAYLLIITSQIGLAKAKMGEKRLAFADISIINVEHSQIPGYLNRAKVGLAFYRPGYSRKGCSPVKAGEYLACGIPLVINQGIGDMDRIITDNKIGAVVSAFCDHEYCKAISTIKELFKEPLVLRRRCRAVAEEYFSLSKGVDKYQQIYQRLLEI